jgi:hypothetical protein
LKQREVQDADNVRWTCVQALAGVDGAAADEAAEKVEGSDGTVPVVCTPSGGAETLRLSLPAGWEDAMTDEELLAAITAAS